MTTPSDLEALAPLDWHTLSCQCTQHRHPCPNQATHIVHIHAISDCNQPGLNAGDRVEIRCWECILRLQAEVGYRLMKVNQWGLGSCGTCGAPMQAVTDVVRSVEVLR